MDIRAGRKTTRAAAIVLVLGLAAAIPGAASADSGTFTGSLAGTACGPKQSIRWPRANTTIDVVATADVAANDITLELFRPRRCANVAHGDTLTSPEEIQLLRILALTPGTWKAQVCPFTGGLVDGSGHIPRHVGDPPAGRPFSVFRPPPFRLRLRLRRSSSAPAGNLTFAPATVVDAQRTEGEPLNFIDRTGTTGTPGRTASARGQSWVHRSTDGGDQFNIVSFVGPSAEPAAGRRRHRRRRRRPGRRVLRRPRGPRNLGCAVCEDNGNNWTTNQLRVRGHGRRPPVVRASTTARRRAARQHRLPRLPADRAWARSSTRRPGSTGPTDRRRSRLHELVRRPRATRSAGRALRPAALRPGAAHLYYPCNEGDHVEITVGHVDPGQRTGHRLHERPRAGRRAAGRSGTSSRRSRPMPPGTCTRSGSTRPTTTSTTRASTNQGKTWGPVHRSTATTRTRTSSCGRRRRTRARSPSPGSATSSHLDSDFMPSWYNNRQAADAVQVVRLRLADQERDGDDADLRAGEVHGPAVHYGQICNQGLFCTVSMGDRTMADFFSLYLDRDGSMRIVFNDTTSQHHGAHVFEVRQVAGPSAIGTTISKPVPDEPGDRPDR